MEKEKKINKPHKDSVSKNDSIQTPSCSIFDITDRIVFVSGIILFILMLALLVLVILGYFNTDQYLSDTNSILNQDVSNSFFSSIYFYLIIEGKISLFIVIWEIISSVLLLTLSLRDLKSFEISSKPLWIMTFNIIIINLVCYYIYTIISNTTWMSLNITFDPVRNLLFALLFGGVSTAIVFVSREKALGFGDILAFMCMSALLGSSYIILGLNLTVIGGLIFALIVGYKKKSLKGRKIPLIFFISLSIILTFIVDIII